MTEEQKEKINRKGTKHTKEAKIKISLALKGRVLSEETKKKMSESVKNRSDEFKKKALNNLKSYWKKKQKEIT